MNDYPIIEFELGYPDELKEVIWELLAENKWLCPLWLQVVTVEFYPNEQDFDLRWRLYKDYRAARLDVCPTFLQNNPRARREMMIHEIIHCYTIPLKTVITEAMEDLKVENHVADILYRQVGKVMEQVTQDFAFAIARK